MEKYRNRREMHRSGGRFATTPTLEQQGYAINTERKTCGQCSHQWTPILTTGKCPLCATALKPT